MGFGLGGQGYPGHLQQDPPPLPQHLCNDNRGGPSRPSVFAGIARAGQALRRRVLSPVFQQVSGYPQVPSSFSALEGNSEGRHEGREPQHEGLFPPSVADATQELTTRPSLLTATSYCQQHQGRDESSASSLSPERSQETSSAGHGRKGCAAQRSQTAERGLKEGFAGFFLGGFQRGRRARPRGSREGFAWSVRDRTWPASCDSRVRGSCSSRGSSLSLCWRQCIRKQST